MTLAEKTRPDVDCRWFGVRPKGIVSPFDPSVHGLEARARRASQVNTGVLHSPENAWRGNIYSHRLSELQVPRQASGNNPR